MPSNTKNNREHYTQERKLVMVAVTFFARFMAVLYSYIYTGGQSGIVVSVGAYHISSSIQAAFFSLTSTNLELTQIWEPNVFQNCLERKGDLPTTPHIS